MFVCLGRWHIGMLENKPWSLQCVNWNKKIGKINLSNLFGLLENEKNIYLKKKDEINFNKFIGVLENERK